MPALFAISDLHVAYAANRQAFAGLPAHPGDGLILAGDLAEKLSDVRWVFETAKARFGEVFWVPGNHELWTATGEGEGQRGVAKYDALVSLARSLGVHTPDDPFISWESEGQCYRIAPLFVLYDYSFRPRDVPLERALAWAEESGIACADEYYLSPEPFASRIAWCEDRLRTSEQRLVDMRSQTDEPLILVNHFPLREDLVFLPAIPRFSLWCGTTQTHDWPTRFGAHVVVGGHLHVRYTQVRDGVRFEEVSLGYPRQWRAGTSIVDYLRRIV